MKTKKAKTAKKNNTHARVKMLKQYIIATKSPKDTPKAPKICQEYIYNNSRKEKHEKPQTNLTTDGGTHGTRKSCKTAQKTAKPPSTALEIATATQNTA